jgi:hypothetical protein
LTGTAGSDTIVGGSAADTIVGGTSADTLTYGHWRVSKRPARAHFEHWHRPTSRPSEAVLVLKAQVSA